MTVPRCGPLVFLMTGLAWLLAMALSGMALYVGTVRSTPLPATLRLVHAHGALLGGFVQMLVGALLLARRSHNPAGTGSQWGRYLTLNLGTIGMLIGFWLHQYPLVGTGGLLAVVPLLALTGDVYRLTKNGLLGAAWTPWSTAFLLSAFIVGSAFGVLYSFALVPPDWAIHTRLAHLHLLIFGFLLVVLVGLLQDLTAAALRSPIWSPRLARTGVALLLFGIAGLLSGFGLAQVQVQIGTGALLLLAATLLGYNLLRTWLTASAGSGGADHLLMGALFLVLAMILGLLVAVNASFDPHPMPFGTLHLVAYTHMMFVGSVIHLVCGGLSTWLPELLAQERISSQKKRPAYATRLVATLERWRAVQLGALTLGTMGLTAVAALTWEYPLSAPPVQQTMWVSLALLLVSLIVFAAKVARACGQQPQERERAT